MPGPKKVLFVVPYPVGHAPSQRFRVESFLPILERAGILYTVLPFFDEEAYFFLYNKFSLLKKVWGVLKGFLKRIVALLKIQQYEYIFIHREASPLGPPFFEFCVAKILRKKIIYDFDDAIWIPDNKNIILNWFKAYWKIKLLCRWSYKVVAGNEFLYNFAIQYNKNVILIPTCVDVENKHCRVKDQDQHPITIGWTGSHSTLRYLDPIIPVLKFLAESYGVRTVIICNKRPEFSFKDLQYIKWNEATEIDDLLKMHIGIMPLQNDSWSEGKCGFKLIQYLSLGIPAVASPVGVNKQIIEQEINGFLCSSCQEWKTALITLIDNVQLRKKMGASGRGKVITNFSVQAYAACFINLFF